jgi:hypothetical protein
MAQVITVNESRKTTGIIARGLWCADWERLEVVWRAVDRPPCNELIPHPESPAAQSRNLTRRPRPDLRLLHHCAGERREKPHMNRYKELTNDWNSDSSCTLTV